MKLFIIFWIVLIATLSQQNHVIAQPPSPVISIDPSKLVDRAKQKYNLKDFAGAMADLNQAIEANPRYARAYNGRGVLKFAQKDLGGSLSDYNMSITLDPKHAPAYVNRGILKVARGNLNDALVDFNLAVNINPKLADAYRNRGVMFIKLGRKEAALKDLQKSIQLYEGQGNQEDAREIQKVIKKLNQLKV